MQKFSEHFKEIEHCNGRVILRHTLFGTQTFYCDDIHIIDDGVRLGVILKSQEIFVDKQSVKFARIRNNTFAMADDMMRIEIIVNKM